MAKPRYWSVAFPLVITSLCVAPEVFFKKHWVAVWDLVINKLPKVSSIPTSKKLSHSLLSQEKVQDSKSNRVPLLNGLLRLMWTYMYRCQDSASTTTSRLDTMLKSFFPPGELRVKPHEENFEPLIYICHFILSRHWDFAKDWMLESLIQELAVNNAVQTANAVGYSNVVPMLAPERTAIAIQATLLTLSQFERDAGTPSWPSSFDFNVFPSREDYPNSAVPLPMTVLNKSNSLKDYFERCGVTLGFIANACADTVLGMCVYDDKWSYAKMGVTYEESHNFVVREHKSEGLRVAYPQSFLPQISLLQTCFQSWPRFLHSGTIALSEAVDMLLRGVVHVEPILSDMAASALRRFMVPSSTNLSGNPAAMNGNGNAVGTDDEAETMKVVLERFNSFMFQPHLRSPPVEITPVRLLVECVRLLDLWVSVVDGWVQSLLKKSREVLLGSESQVRVMSTLASEIENGGMFLVSCERRHVHVAGVKVLRILGLLTAHLASPDGEYAVEDFVGLHCVQLLHGRGDEDPQAYLRGFDEHLDLASDSVARLMQRRQEKKRDVMLRIADSSKELDKKLWRFVFPRFLGVCMQRMGARAAVGNGPLAGFREVVMLAAQRYHPTMSFLAGLSNRVPIGLKKTSSNPNYDKDGVALIRENKLLIEQWHLWLRILCSTAVVPDASRPANIGRDQHQRTTSAADMGYEKERLTTTRGLFRHLTPFLDSEYSVFRDAAVHSISSFPSDAYPTLLDDLSLLAGRQFYDEQRMKTSQALAIEQNINGLNARQPYDDPRLRAGVPLAGERNRRQERLHSAVAKIYSLTAHHLENQRGPAKQQALINVLKFVRNTLSMLTSPEMKDNWTLQRLRRHFCGTVEKLFEGMNALEGSDRWIPAGTHLVLYRLCEEWCQLGEQPEIVRRRQVVMRNAAAAGAPHIDSGAALQIFDEETTLLSNAAVGALASLCVSSISVYSLHASDLL
jgi:hypothetical protein